MGTGISSTHRHFRSRPVRRRIAFPVAFLVQEQLTPEYKIITPFTIAEAMNMNLSATVA
jgi:hypothetical protein